MLVNLTLARALSDTRRDASNVRADTETAAAVSGGSSRLVAIISNICVWRSDPDRRGWMRDITLLVPFDTSATMNVHAIVWLMLFSLWYFAVVDDKRIFMRIRIYENI